MIRTLVKVCGVGASVVNWPLPASANGTSNYSRQMHSCKALQAEMHFEIDDLSLRLKVDDGG